MFIFGGWVSDFRVVVFGGLFFMGIRRNFMERKWEDFGKELFMYFWSFWGCSCNVSMIFSLGG